ncbi:ribonuclease HII [Sulfurospirillum arcachonense]|uniref:ribonuclease HII n=1 Tax=Sulfurospirillum arcachonense TaxID=57666 RepID=UPI000468E113|nr:ribonuclease HII [Sulfurospirillum arcachonense]
MLCGIDEAGRGCIAGPLVVAGVIINKKIDGLNDSKQLSEKKRETLFEDIKENTQYKIVFCDNEMVDKKGLSYCLGYSIQTIKDYFLKIDNKCKILMDGNSSFGVQGIETMIKADAKVAEVSAASILAKVSRDRYMYSIAEEYSNYSFTKHKGYGTALHVKEIEKFGYSKIHRKSFKIKSLREPTLF